MSEEQLFYVEKNDSWQTYAFLESRQNDIQWHAAFLDAQALLAQEESQKQRRKFTVLIVAVPVLVLGLMAGVYFYDLGGEPVIPQRTVTLNTAISSSESTTEKSETIDTSSVGQVLVTPWGEQVTVLRVLSNGEHVINENATQSDLNNDGLLTYEELSKVQEEANQQQSPQQDYNATGQEQQEIVNDGTNQQNNSTQVIYQQGQP
ncbi:hypothetical protein [Enterococcus hermanniensis]|uniref:EF-hand domain-containing protein n=1 Tax=Enterococcus hermanniensis TaxID=249189 RepID=A0A1L8TR23_9ENTE|nr:hypothetical protein [Enterococcus hermanniensis]OJG46638.1 hypothetical protein RV04_GL001066 [Enterococcus hermanniensis]